MRGQAIFILLLLVSTIASSKTWVVESTGKFNSVKSALEQAANGDTIRILPGHYREGSLKINKSVTIIGVGYPVIDGENKFEIFSVSAPDVSIIGLRLVNTGIGSIDDISAVNALTSDRLRVLNNKLENTFFGIHLLNSNGCLVEGNTLRSGMLTDNESGNGIHAWKCDSLTVRNNDVSGHRDGVYFEFVTNSLVEKNISHANLRYGLHFMFSQNNEYRDNIFRDNGAGVAVMYSHGVRMIGNHFEDNWGAAAYGVLLKDISDSFIDQNLFSRNTAGLYLEGTNRSIFSRNVFEENGWAVRMQSNCDGNVFEHNTFVSNTFDISTNGTMVLNTLDYNYWDKYEGYDLDKDNIGDVPFHPVSLYSMVVEKMPASIMLWRSFLVYLLDRTEKVIPSVTPENLVDMHPKMRLVGDKQ